MIKWIKQNKIEILFFLIIIFLSAFLRFYHLPEYMTFLGDEGRDALIIKQILIEHNLPFIGPPTSVGNIYLGPLYYYMMAVSMAIFWLNPVAAAGMVALIGVLTVALIYYLGRSWFGPKAAIVSAFLYSVSPVNIIYSRSSWNPNPAPFFTLLIILGIWKARQTHDFRWLGLTGAALAAALQMHYLTLILLPVVSILWLYELFQKQQKYKYFLLGTILFLLGFFAVMLPLVLFDLRHNFMNYRAITTLFRGENQAIGFNFLSSLANIPTIYFSKLIMRYIGAGNYLITIGAALGTVASLLIAVRSKQIKDRWPYFALGTWIILGLVGLSFYHQSIYDHYLGFLNPAPFLLLGGLVGVVKRKRETILILLMVVVIGFFNLQKNPLLLTPNNQLKRTQNIAHFIINESQNKPFNFALIAKNNYDAAYQYYLDLYGYKPKVVPSEITDQLFVVCEDAVCNPVGHPKYEIAGFGWVKIDRQYEVEGLKIYKLVENPEGRKFKANH